jgi:hypothetical protein
MLTTVLAVLAAAPADASRTVTRVSAPTGVAEGSQDINFAAASANADHVFFTTSQPMTVDDTDGAGSDVFERFAGTTGLVSAASGLADPNTGSPSAAKASRDGLRIYFTTTQKLTPEDTDSGRMDVYLRFNGFTTLVSGPTGVADPDTSDISSFSISPDGQRVWFNTTQKLTADDTDSNRLDTYVHESGTTRLLTGALEVPDPDTDIATAFMSDDGSRWLIDTKQKLTAEDTDTGREDVYLRENGTTALLTKPTDLPDPNTADVVLEASSPDARHAVFRTGQTMTADDNDSGVDDLYTVADGHTQLVTKEEGLDQPDLNGFVTVGLSADGSRVLYTTRQRMLAEDANTNGIDVYEWSGGHQHLISAPEPGSSAALGGIDTVVLMTPDLNHVLFSTAVQLTGDDTNGSDDIYEHADGHTRLVSIPQGVPHPDTVPQLTGVSDDGTRVFFRSPGAWTADDTDAGHWDLYERAYGATRLVSAPDPGAPSSDSAELDDLLAAVGTDGVNVVLTSFDSLTPDDADGAADVFVARLKPPGASTGAPSGQTLHGTATPFGTPTKAWFEWGATTAYGSSTPPRDAGTGEDATAIDETPAGLAPGTTYHARLVAESVAGRVEGADVTFTAPAVGAVEQAPVVSGLRLSRKTFRLGRKRARIARAKVGTIISFRLSKDARVTLKFTRKRGRRYVSVKGGVALRAKAGRVRIRFQGRLDGKARLHRGRHRLRLVATDTGGRRSKPARAAFRVVS